MANEKVAVLVEVEPSQKKSITEINKIAAKVLDDERNIKISNPEAIATIGYEWLNACINYLAANATPGNDVLLDLMGLVRLGVTYREDADEETEGNFTPYAEAGPIFKKAIKDNESTESED